MFRTVVFAAAVAFALLAACASGPTRERAFAPAGLIAHDTNPPAGAEQWARPTLRQGDSYRFRRGGRIDIALTVSAVDEQGYTFTNDEGERYQRTLDLGNLGHFDAAGKPLHVIEPVDMRYHWPLWVGKKWRCQVVENLPDGTQLPLEIAYQVEDLDDVEVPAGTFKALRIRRVVRLMAEEQFFDRTMVIWYAPAIGVEVRQLLGDTALELVAWSQAAQKQ